MTSPRSDKPRRRTQAERSAATRTTIMEAAITCLYAHGYGGTTTGLIERTAGVSRGAMLHHFPTKADLILATMEHVLDLNHDHFSSALAQIEDPLERYLALPDLRWDLALQPHGTALMEILVGARSDPPVRGRFPEFQERLFEKQRQRLAERAGQAGLPLTPRDQLISRTIVLAIRGLAIEKQVHPDTDVEGVLGILRELKESGVASHRPKRKS